MHARPGPTPASGWARASGLAAALLALGCASVEKGRYGVRSVDVQGAQAIDDEALRACLVTVERPSFGLKLGVASPECNRPPFESSAPTLHLWRWPWTEWPTFNQAVFSRDRERILRFYRARGFFDATVREVRFEPPEAARSGAKGPCDPEREQCTVNIVVVVNEGEPTLVDRVAVRGIDSLDASLRRQIAELAEALRDARFDETTHDEKKKAIRDALRARGYAAAKVDGKVEIDTASHRANVELAVAPGPVYTFGTLGVSGQGTLPSKPIVAAADLRTGKRYDPSTLHELQAEVFALGAFSAVELNETLDPARRRVNVDVHVAPLSPEQLRVGFGVLSGATRRTETGELTSIPQWDLHLFGTYERRHVFGTLGRVRLEERPRLILNEPFPQTAKPTYGNLVGLRLDEPGLVEARTNLFASSSWDYGPDAFLGFRRSDILARVGVSRGFFARRLIATLAVEQDLFLVPSLGNPTSDGSPTPTPYTYAFVEQDLRLDFRDNRQRPTLGAYFGLNVSEAPRFAASDWALVRLAPEVRGYLPLPLDTVLAARFALGSAYVLDASAQLDASSRQLGPSSYRLRGGGANSNRGFLPGQLGAGIQGGLRRWESTAELRFALGADFGIVGFLDVGDVNDAPHFRFSHLNTTAGTGLRYYTVIGVLRVDVGFRIRPWQRVNGDPGIEADANRLPFTRIPGAAHFTIGESF